MIYKCLKLVFLQFIRLITFLFPYNTKVKLSSYIEAIISKWLILQLPKASNTSIIGRHSFVKGKQYIEIGERTSIGKYAVVTAWDYYKQTNQKFSPQIIIGNNVNIGEFSHITSINKIVIGDGVLTGRRVTITDNSHGKFVENELGLHPIDRPLYSKGKVIIGKNVWIGDKVTILPNVHIGDGAVIAANTVVAKDVPQYSVCAGNPGRIIKVLNH